METQNTKSTKTAKSEVTDETIAAKEKKKVAKPSVVKKKVMEKAVYIEGLRRNEM